MHKKRKGGTGSLSLGEVLYGHHGEVVALLCLAYKLVDGGGHLTDEGTGLVTAMGEGLGCYVMDALQLELGIVAIHSLGEAVGEKEDGGAWGDGRLLQSVLP